MQNITKIVAIFSFLLVLTSCESDNSNDDKMHISPATADCYLDYCGSATNNTYLGSGIGIWRYINNQYGTINFDISIHNVENKDITVIFTNEKNNNVVFPENPSNLVQNPLFNIKKSISTNPDISFNNIPEHIRSFDAAAILKQATLKSNQHIAKLASIKSLQVGDTKEWKVHPGITVEYRSATLEKQLSSGDRVINFWVENDEYAGDKITETMLDDISHTFVNDIYKNVVEIAGEPWGAHQYGNLLIEQDQPLNIVFVNFDKNHQAGGLLGYFYATHNFVKDSRNPESNEALVLFVDTETIYLYSRGSKITLSTMSHELTHAINFYQRSIKMSPENAYDVFLEELTAIMMEDLISNKIDPSFNSIRDTNYYQWLKEADYNCDFTTWDIKNKIYCRETSYVNYNTAGSFGAYLLRHYGLSFYKQLLRYPMQTVSSNNRANSIALLDKVIKNYNNEGFARAVQRWGANIALLPANYSPKGFGYPSVSQDGFKLEAFDGDDFQAIRNFPTSKPGTLAAYGHYPVYFKSDSYSFRQSVNVPNGVSVTIVVK